MIFEKPLIPGRLIRRYKRFLADIELETGEVITAHCPNSGSMLTCNIPGREVLLSFHDNPNRKYAHTWEMVRVSLIWVGINTQIPNRLVYETILDGQIPEFIEYTKVQKEKKVGQHSRLDLMLSNDKETCYVEIKNVTLVENDVALFPDAVTVRGTRHLMELMKLREQGHRAVIFFLIQREDARLVAPADKIDAKYGETLRQAFANGVEILPYQAVVSPQEIRIKQKLDFRF